MKEYKRYVSGFDKATHEKLSSKIRLEMADNKIYIRHIAEELNKSVVTINLWLLKNVTQERHDILMGAINRILEKRKETV